MGMYCI